MKSLFGFLDEMFFDDKKKEKDNPAAERMRNSQAYADAKARYEEMYDELEGEYRSVLQILQENEGDQMALTEYLAEAEARITDQLEALPEGAAQIEQTAEDDVSGSEIEALLKLGPRLFNAGKTEAAEYDVKAVREAPLKALAEELKQREGDFSGDNAERIGRISAKLEQLTFVMDVFSKMGSVF